MLSWTCHSLWRINFFKILFNTFVIEWVLFFLWGFFLSHQKSFEVVLFCCGFFVWFRPAIYCENLTLLWVMILFNLLVWFLSQKKGQYAIDHTMNRVIFLKIICCDFSVAVWHRILMVAISHEYRVILSFLSCWKTV